MTRFASSPELPTISILTLQPYSLERIEDRF
jgi:hypothetical protein